MTVKKPYAQLIQELEDASIELRYCTDPVERATLASKKRLAEQAIEDYEKEDST